MEKLLQRTGLGHHNGPAGAPRTAPAGLDPQVHEDGETQSTIGSGATVPGSPAPARGRTERPRRLGLPFYPLFEALWQV